MAKLVPIEQGLWKFHCKKVQELKPKHQDRDKKSTIEEKRTQQRDQWNHQHITDITFE
jgi:hypothetical protein